MCSFIRAVLLMGSLHSGRTVTKTAKVYHCALDFAFLCQCTNNIHFSQTHDSSICLVCGNCQFRAFVHCFDQSICFLLLFLRDLQPSYFFDINCFSNVCSLPLILIPQAESAFCCALSYGDLYIARILPVLACVLLRLQLQKSLSRTIS